MKKLLLVGALLMWSSGANAAEERSFSTFGILSNNVSVDALGVQTALSQNYLELGTVKITQFDPVFYASNVYGGKGFISMGFHGYYSLYQKDGFRVGLGVGAYVDLNLSSFKVGDTGLLGAVKVLSQSKYPWLYYADYTRRLTGTPSGVTNENLSVGFGYSF